MQAHETNEHRLADQRACQEPSLTTDQLRQKLAAAERARDAAERANRAKSESLAGMSHELRTPLNAIIGFSDVLKEQIFGPLNESQLQYVTDILEGGQQLLSLLNDILDLAKIESGMLDVEWHETDVAEIVARALQLVQERAMRAEVKLSSEISDANPVVNGDGRRLRQLLLNLLAIALKAAPPGGTVAVRLGRAADGVQLSVADSGAAFAAAEQAPLPDAPNATDLQRAKDEPAHCLGLALVGQIAQLHRGRVWAKSHAGGGSEFFVWLPVHPDATPTDGAQPGSTSVPLTAAVADVWMPAIENSIR
ncbi:MAG TPA: HAMP domain-containing sensor histidine kinase [Pirellulales bacterium]